MRILFRADCDRSIGTGHLFRCREMAKYFKEKGWNILFLINDYEFTEKIVKDYDYKKIALYDIRDEIMATKEILKEDTFDIIVVDFYEKGKNDELMSIFAEHAMQAVVAITDDFNKVNIKSDVLIASHPRQNQYDYKNIRQKVLTGERYFIVSQEFIQYKITVRREIANILISFGGHDPHNVAYDVARNILSATQTYDFSNATFNFLIGGIYRYENELNDLLGKSRIKYIFHKNLRSVLPLFLESDIAITACGNTLYELCNIGIPAIVVALNDRQHEAGKLLHDKNLIEYAGYYSEIEQSAFNDLFLRLLNSYEDRLNLHDHCTEHFGLNPLNKIYLMLTGEKYETKR